LIISFIKALPNETTGIHQILNILDSIEIENELKIVYSHKFLVTSITNLESDSLSTEDQVSILKDVEHLVESKISMLID
jgi:hypothetical protein